MAQSKKQKVDSGIAIGGSVGGDVAQGDIDKSVVGKPGQGPCEKFLGSLGKKLDSILPF